LAEGGGKTLPNLVKKRQKGPLKKNPGFGGDFQVLKGVKKKVSKFPPKRGVRQYNAQGDLGLVAPTKTSGVGEKTAKMWT